MNISFRGSSLHRRAGDFRKPLRSALQRRARTCRVYANAKADALLEQAKGKYKSGDRMTAMRLFEQTLEQDSLEASQRHAALWGQLAVHASFGDVELAQMVLRDAVQAGLDFEAAQQDPAFVEIQSSPQIVIQLGRFNKQVQRRLANQADERASMAAAAAKAERRSGGSISKVSSDMDLNDLLGPSDKSKQGLDASPAAIAGRVALVLLAGVILGVALFFLGLEFMFPKGMQ